MGGSMTRLTVSLCDYSGAWSRPYVPAGYRVIHGVIVDDAKITGHGLGKWYVAVGDSPRVEVTLSRMPGGWP